MNQRPSHLAAIALIAFTIISTSANAVTLSSSIDQANGHPGTNLSTTGDIGTFSFDNPTNIIGNITGLSLTLTLDDGDTGPGDFDRGQLRLSLDGYDTGLVLDEFGNDQTDTRELTLTSLDDNLAQSLWASLVDDGKFELVAMILDADDDDSRTGPGDSPSKKNFMRLPNGFEATLTLTGAAPSTRVSSNSVPEPTTLVLAGLGLTGAALARRRPS